MHGIFYDDLSEEFLTKPENRSMYMAKNLGWIAVSYEPPELPKTKPSEQPQTKLQAKPQTKKPANKKAAGFFTVRGQLRSLGFGLACGTAVIAVFLFTMFNELVITPFIHPDQGTGQAPALDKTGEPVDTAPKIRIPKINVEIPLVYDAKSSDEKDIETALDKGVVHYPSTVLPGQTGNSAFFGHSSNNILNPGKYKFAFILLHELQPKDTFYLTNDGKLYTYEVISRRVVNPSEVGVLGPVAGQSATATLITCDPPGTSNNRLIVVGKQISPDPATNGVAAPPIPAEAAPATESLPGNGPGPLTRLWRTIMAGF
jgi:LPXTG-site transpeptidase (sortase) family protein